ncbi:hypothetical protein KC356_g335 [Hortaea werneckii]|nr:hypothetical protein KC356_g335 [Hortaea werneckii]
MAVLPKLWALRDGSKLQLHFGLHGAPSEPGPVDSDDVEAAKKYDRRQHRRRLGACHPGTCFKLYFKRVNFNYSRLPLGTVVLYRRLCASFSTIVLPNYVCRRGVYIYHVSSRFLCAGNRRLLPVIRALDANGRAQLTLKLLKTKCLASTARDAET